MVGDDGQDIAQGGGRCLAVLLLFPLFRPGHMALDGLPLVGVQGQVVQPLPVAGLVTDVEQLGDFKDHRLQVGLGIQRLLEQGVGAEHRLPLRT